MSPARCQKHGEAEESTHGCRFCFYELADRRLFELEDCLVRLTGGGDETLRAVLKKLGDANFTIHDDAQNLNLTVEFFRREGGYR
jgi:hypothetical protein